MDLSTVVGSKKATNIWVFKLGNNTSKQFNPFNTIWNETIT